MSAESFTPEGIWGRVDAAVVAMQAAQTERDAETLRMSLAVVLADAVVEGGDLDAATAEYAQARAAHAYAQINATAARSELRASRGVDVWSVA